MHKNYKGLLSLLTAGIITLGISVPGMAATKKEETRIPISAVTINVTSYIEDGDDKGHIEVTTMDPQYSVGNTDWGTFPADGWKVGDEPKVKVYLHARNGYYFDKNVSNKKIVVNGATASSVKKEDEDETVTITLKLNKVKGTLEEPEDAEWVGYPLGKASWTAVPNASAYELKLYRNEQQIHSVERCVGTSFDFYPYMTQSGSYTFRVRCVPVSSAEALYITPSDWTYSDDEDIAWDDTADYVYSGEVSENKNINNPSDVGWVKDGDGWRYRYADGSFAKSTWYIINNKWYYFDYDGYMLTGWQTIGGFKYCLSDSGDLQVGWIQYGRQWYYANPANGQIMLGWVQVANKWYYMDPATGMLRTDWVLTDGKWYYLDPADGGAMSVNKMIGEHYVNNEGVWVQK